MNRSPLRCAAMLIIFAGCAHLPSQPRVPPAYWGFTGPWDRHSDTSVEAHGSSLERVITGWIAIDTTSFRPVQLYPDSIGKQPVVAPRAMALITTYFGSRFHPEVIRGLGDNAQVSALTAGAIASLIDSGGYHGVVIDFEGMTGADTALTRAVVAAIAGAARARGVGPVAIAIPASDTVGYPARLFESSADLLLIMLYDQHWATSPAGAIAEPLWVRRTLAMRVAESGANRVVAALPLYGYQWRADAPTAIISYDDARRLAAEAGVALDRDPATSTLHAMRAGPDGWELWVSDAVLIEALQREVASLGVRRVAYWRLGLEDPAIWR